MASCAGPKLWFAGVIRSAVWSHSRRLGLDVVAEGVERNAEAEVLLANGCHLMQGFKYCKPVSPQALEAFWRDLLQGQAKLQEDDELASTGFDLDPLDA